MAEREILNIALKYKAQVASRFAVDKMILFGSYAKGTETVDSDIDIAVVLKNYQNRLETQYELMLLSSDIDSRIEPHPFKKSEFNSKRQFVSEIIKYGQII
jgi:predicted nucleotidyltransferase